MQFRYNEFRYNEQRNFRPTCSLYRGLTFFLNKTLTRSLIFEYFSFEHLNSETEVIFLTDKYLPPRNKNKIFLFKSFIVENLLKFSISKNLTFFFDNQLQLAKNEHKQKRPL
ncbi:hypothetical protein BpHYR1_050791 [Brachionus plicatilis]|uniref:Uncharacterized protein n=1 Tax=Brachionus plicatilis TaxID=10195 RepID=A0A3M7Q7S7_BRAPC|nr:hypothetical protein BpHYR1_050791 [Brachionus plicatilis]